jgi:hypothetical protein
MSDEFHAGRCLCGTFDDPNRFEVTSHIWLQSAQTGFALPAGVDCYAKARATLDGVPELPRRVTSS